MRQRIITWEGVQHAAAFIAGTWADKDIDNVYGIPRGGLIPAALVAAHNGWRIVSSPHTPNTLIVDDLIDSGTTRQRYAGLPFAALYTKTSSDGWYVFPWEQDNDEQHGPTDAVIRLLQHVGEDPTREGLVDTPKRVIKALTEMTAGYQTDIPTILSRTFANDGYTGLVMLDTIDFVSLCEHHMLPFAGTATVGYIPASNRVVGLSKLARLVDAYARRLQVQERMTEQIADALQEHLQPEGVAVIIRATHSCMTCRGIRKPRGVMTTSAMRGALLTDPAARAELLALETR